MKKKTWIIVIAVLAVLAAVLFFVLRQNSRCAAPVYETSLIARGDMENSVTATGTVEPMEQVEVGTQVSGIIDKIYVDYNSCVKKGQVIAELDKIVLQAELETARLSVESNKNEFLYQEKNHKRNKRLYEKKMLSESEFETSQYNYNRAKIAYEQSLAQEVKARTNLGYATIYSPIDGIVISKGVEVGQTVAASFSTPTLFTIANDLQSMQVVADVDEADIGQVKEGAEVTFTVDAYPEEVFEGRVNQVRMQANTNNNVVTYEVVILAENPELKLKPGLTANVSIYSMRRQNVLCLPVKATRFRPIELANKEMPGGKPFPKDSMRRNRSENPDGGVQPPMPRGKACADSVGGERKIVFVMNREACEGELAVQPKMVRVGVSDRIYYEVLDGLKEGDEVCVGMGVAGAQDAAGPAARSPFMPGPPGGSGNKNRKK